MGSRDPRLAKGLGWTAALGCIVACVFFPSVPARGQHNENATVLSTELSTGEGSGPFTALGQATAANLFTGDANLSVPIQVPPGRGDMTPSLGLTYSSGARDGPFGFGWNIALGAIARSTRDGVPTCVEDNEFTLDIPGASVELLKHASFPSIYYARIDEAFIEATADEANNTWTVHDRAGRTYRFGTVPTARAWTGSDVFMDQTGCDFTALWALTQIEDSNGNTIDFLYTNIGNAPLIDEIQYGANPAAGLNAHPFKIDFQTRLEPRTYPHQSHRLGVQQTFTELIAQIDVHYLGSPHRTYALSYTETPFGGRALLDRIDATGLPARTFTYAGSDAEYIQEESRANPFADDSLLLTKGYDSNSTFRVENAVLDMNGDGFPDAVQVNPADPSAWNVYLGDDSAFDGSPIAWDITNLPAGAQDAIRRTNRSTNEKNKTRFDTLDITGDGIPDFVDARNLPWQVYPGTCTSLTTCGFSESITGGWSAPSKNLGVVDLEPDGSLIQRAVIDLNGDGYLDYVDAGDGIENWDVYLGTPTGFEASPTAFTASGWIGITGARLDTNLIGTHLVSKRRVFDFNGDGLPDLLTVDDSQNHWVDRQGDLLSSDCGGDCLESNVVQVHLNTGSGFGPPIVSSLGSHHAGYLSHEIHTESALPNAIGPGCTSTTQDCYEFVFRDFFDVNGDGLPDYVVSNAGVNTSVLLNIGGGRLESGPQAIGHSTFEHDLTIKRAIPGVPKFPQIRALRERLSQTVSGQKSTRCTAEILDLNGDGLIELVEVLENQSTWRADVVAAFKEPMDPIQPPGRLVEADDGAGALTGFRYTPSTQFDNGGADGAPDLPAPKWVTEAIRQTDGLCPPNPEEDPFDPVNNTCLQQGHERLRLYEYAGGLFDAGEREFRGFGMVTEIDSDGNETETIFSQADFTRGKILSERVRAVDGATSYDVRIVTNDWRAIEDVLHVGRAQVYLAETTSEERGVPDVVEDRLCSISRNAPPDAYGRVSTSCTYECASSLPAVCEPAEGQVLTQTEWANPTGGSYVRERPSEVSTSYVPSGTTPVLLAKKRMRYDGAAGSDPLAFGLVTNGNVRSVESWLDQSLVDPTFPGWLPAIRMEYDAYGNLTQTTNERGHTWTTAFDDATFRIHPIAHTAPTTGGVAHQTHTVTDLRFGKPLSITDENNQTTSFAYDALGRLTCEAGPGESLVGCAAAQAGIGFDVTRVFLYAFGNPGASSFEDRLTTVETRVFNDTAPLDFTSTIAYFDALGRERFAKVQRTIGTAAPTSPPQTVIEGQVKFDSESRAISQYAPYQATTAHQDPSTASVPATTLTYQLNGTAAKDPLGRVHVVNPPDGQSIDWTYLGRVTRSQDASGAAVVTERDHLGRIVAQENHDTGGRVVGSNLTYDGAGRVLTRETSEDASTRVTYVYDTLGRAVDRADPNAGGSWRYGYDEVGNLVYVDDPKPSQHVQASFDALNRLRRRCHHPSDAFVPGMTEVQCASTGIQESVYRYDEATGNFGVGRLTTATDNHSNEVFSYDERGRLARQQRVLPSPHNAETSYEYDRIGRLTKITYPGADEVVYGYNASGQLITIQGVVDDIDYDFMGRRTQMVRSNGTTDTWSYYGSAENFRLQKVQTTGPTSTHLDLSYAYNNIGKVSAITDHRNPIGSPPDPLSNTATFTYDTIGRLDQVTGSSFDDDYDFDTIGNLIRKGGESLGYLGLAGPHQVGSVGTTTTITYDANGLRKQKSNPGVEVESYNYNAFDQLVRIDVDNDVVLFQRDYAGRIVTKQTNAGEIIRYYSRLVESQGGTLTKHYWAGDLLIASSHVDAATVKAIPVRFSIPVEWLMALGSVVVVLLLGAGLQLTRAPPEGVLVARSLGVVLLILATGPPMLLVGPPARAGGGGSWGDPLYLGVRHYHVDRLGSTQVVTDDVGAVLQQLRYDAYGAIRTRVDDTGAPINGPSDDARRVFTGYEDENLSGLQYAGARFYDPELGQFLTHDPSEQFPSPYAYGPGDPMNGTDPTGAIFLELGLLFTLFLAGVSASRASLQGESAADAFADTLSGVVFGYGLGEAVGIAGSIVGAGGGLTRIAASLASNPLVQNSLAAASVGTQLASFVLGGDAPGGLRTASRALTGLSLGLAFASASSSSAANGVQPARARSSQGGERTGEGSVILGVTLSSNAVSSGTGAREESYTEGRVYGTRSPFAGVSDIRLRTTISEGPPTLGRPASEGFDVGIDASVFGFVGTPRELVNSRVTDLSLGFFEVRVFRLHGRGLIRGIRGFGFGLGLGLGYSTTDGVAAITDVRISDPPLPGR